MKRFEMLPGIAVMRGNVTGSQDIRYQGNKKAYNTTNGKQAAINYRPSYIFHERAKDGLKYFSVRLRQTAVLNGKTRLQMALIGSIAAIKSKLKADGTLTSIQSAYDYVKAHGLIDASVSFNMWVDSQLRYMLRYKRESWSFNQASIAFTVSNPFKLDNANALVISPSVWSKFAPVLSFGATVVSVTIDNVPLVLLAGQWRNIENIANGNYTASIANIAVDGDNDPVTYLGQQVYLDSTAIIGSADIVADAKYATVQA